jgi:Antirestriction protein (ArdA)
LISLQIKGKSNANSAHQSKQKYDIGANKMTTQLHAQPYNSDAKGFNFQDMTQYQEQANNCLDAYGNIVEEFEIQFIDGDDAELFRACQIDQASLSTWFDDVEVLDQINKINLFYLVGCAGYTLEQGLDKIQEPNIYYGQLIDAATELFDECMLPEVPENIRFYIDYTKFARDCQLSGYMVELEYQNTTYTCTNANGL